MSRSTFILIVSIYGFLLGTVMVLAPSQALAYFGRETTDVLQMSLLRFLGAIHLAFAYLAFSLRKSENTVIVKAYLVSAAFLLFVSVALSVYDVQVDKVPSHSTYFLDLAIWAILGTGAVYFWVREKV